MFFYHIILRTSKDQQISRDTVEFFLKKYNYEILDYNEFKVDQLKSKLNFETLKHNFLDENDLYTSIKISVDESSVLNSFIKELCRNHTNIKTKMFFSYRSRDELLKNIPSAAN